MSHPSGRLQRAGPAAESPPAGRAARGGRLKLHDTLYDDDPVATLDLHGFRVSEIEGALGSFLATWTRRAPGQVVHVITGKGRGSPGRPALRPKVRTLLRGPLAPLARDFGRDVDDGGWLIRLR